MSSLVAPSSLHYTACTAWGTAALQDCCHPWLLISNVWRCLQPSSFIQSYQQLLLMLLLKLWPVQWHMHMKIYPFQPMIIKLITSHKR